MAAGARPAVVWMPNVEVVMALANLTDQGPQFSPRAVHPLRRQVWLKFDGHRRSPAVVETSRLLHDGLWLDGLVEVALAAEPLPHAGFSHPLSRETVHRAEGPEAADGVDRLTRYLEYAAAFAMDAGALEFLRAQDEAYHAAADAFEHVLGDMPQTGAMEQYFGHAHRGYLIVVSLLAPAGLSFGHSLQTIDGPMAFVVAGPFLGSVGQLEFGDPSQARTVAEREFLRAFVKPLLSRHQLAARELVRLFDRDKAAWRRMGYERALDCLEDHLVQGIHARLMIRRGEAPAARALLAFDEEAGFAWTRPLAEGLEDYELHRTDFPAFDEFVPPLLEFLAAARAA